MRSPLPIVAGLLVLLLLSPVEADDSLIRNGHFGDWSNGHPDGWTFTTGARTRNEGPASSVGPLAAGTGLRIAGNGETATWRYVRQAVPIQPGAWYELTTEARALGLRQETGQFQSRYVGGTFLGKKGKKLQRQLIDIVRPDWGVRRLVLQAPEEADRLEVGIFLSMTGRLNVRSVALRTVTLTDGFDILCRDMSRHYSYFAHKKLDWPALQKKYRSRARSASDSDALVRVLSDMLAEFRDPHIWIRPGPKASLLQPFQDTPPANVHYPTTASLLNGVRQIGKLGFVGTTKEGFGFVAIGSLRGPDAHFAALEEAIRNLFSRPGIIIDIRANAGGNEVRARRLAGLFCSKPVVYAKQQVRNGPRPDNLSEPGERILAPRGEEPYEGPVACLIGPRCISSGEALALMFKALPGATLLGQPTRGASGNPNPLQLPGSITVWYSRWVALKPDGSVLEGEGVLPDIRVDTPEEAEGDPTLARAERFLSK